MKTEYGLDFPDGFFVQFHSAYHRYGFLLDFYHLFCRAGGHTGKAHGFLPAPEAGDSPLLPTENCSSSACVRPPAMAAFFKIDAVSRKGHGLCLENDPNDIFVFSPVESKERLVLTGLRGDPRRGLRQIPGDDRQRQALSWFRDWAADNHVPFIALLFPLLRSRTSQPERELALTLLQELAIPTVDLLPLLRRRAGRRGMTLDALSEDGLHPNELGHRWAAEFLLQDLTRRGWLDAHRGNHAG